MASIMKRGDSYSVRYKYKDHSGKPCEGWESFKTKKEAVEEGLKLLRRRAAYRDLLALRGKLHWEDPLAEGAAPPRRYLWLGLCAGLLALVRPDAVLFAFALPAIMVLVATTASR